MAGGSTIGSTPDCTANFGQSTFAFSVPAGYTAGFGGAVDHFHSSSWAFPSNIIPVSLTADLLAPVSFFGEVVNFPFLEGTLESQNDLGGWVWSTPLLTGDLQVDVTPDLFANAASVATASAILGVSNRAAASLQSIAVLTADLDVVPNTTMASFAVATTSTTATLAVNKKLAATPASVATVTATSPSVKALAATPAAASTLTAPLFVPVQLAANIAVVAALTAPLAYRLRNFFEVVSGATVAGSLGITYNYRMTYPLEVVYEIRERAKLGLEVVNDIGRVDTRVQAQLNITFNTNAVRFPFEVSYHLSRLQYGLEVVHALGNRVKNALDISFNTNSVRLGLEVSYSNRAQAALDVVSSLGSRVASAFDITYSMSRVSLEFGVSSLLSSRAIHGPICFLCFVRQDSDWVRCSL
jgi:hypothetical protein